MKVLSSVVVFWLMSTSTAFAGKYEKCEIFNGEVTNCTGWYTGSHVAVSRQSGKYEKCEVFNGEVTNCTGWYTGKHVVQR